MLTRVVVLFLIVCLSTRCLSQRTQMCEVLTRSQMTYVLTDAQRQQLRSQGYNDSQDQYNGIYTFTPNPSNGEVFMTAHRLFSPSGIVPYSLAVQRNYKFNDPVYPFPTFEDNQNPPEGIYSAVSTTLDKCGNLWIVDQGIKIFSSSPPVFPVGIFGYSFASQRLTYKYRFPVEFFTKGTVTTRLLVDNSNGCDKLKFIVADTLGYCLLVHDMESGSSWKVCHPTMANDPKYSDFTYKNYTLPLPTGVYNIVISPPLGKSRTTYLLYSSFSGITTYAVPLSIIYNKRLWTQGVSVWRMPYSKYTFKNNFGQSKKFLNDKDNDYEDDVKYIDVNRYFKTIGSDPTHQAQYCDVDLERKIYFCALPTQGSIYAWKFNTPFSHRRTVVLNKEKFINAAILRIFNNRYGKNELVLSTSPIIQIFLGLLEPHPRNYGVYTCPVNTVLQSDNMKCTTGVFNKVCE